MHWQLAHWEALDLPSTEAWSNRGASFAHTCCGTPIACHLCLVRAPGKLGGRNSNTALCLRAPPQIREGLYARVVELVHRAGRGAEWKNF